MNLVRTLAALTLAAAISSPAMALSDKDAETFLLTPALIQKMKKAEPDLKALNINDESEEDEDSSVEDIVKTFDKHPRAKAVLAKHGLTVKEVALGTVAMVHAGMYVAFEGAMDKKGAAEMLAKFTPQQRANIALMRGVVKTQK